MAIAGEGLADLWMPRPPRARASLIGAGVAVAVHFAVGAGLLGIDPARLFRREATVEIEINEPKPPPPELRPEPPPPPPPEPKPRIVARRAPAPETPPPSAAPPPPNQEPPAKPSDAPPVFGVTMSSVVSGDSAGMAVPVGNTLMTKDRKPARPGQATQPYTGETDRAPAPVPEVFIAERPRVINEVKAEYPTEAQRMGIEGHVDAKLLIDENGNVREVKLIKPAGHGFDELAREALKKYKFTPARTSDGKAVPTNIVFRYTFELPQ